VWKRNLIIIYLLIACAAIEVLFFGALIFLKPENFIKMVWNPDTSSYARIAQELTERGSLITSYRTLGYPLFMSLGYIVGGQDYGNYLIIGGQLILNLLFTWGFWKFLERLNPSAPAGVRLLLTLFFFWAGLGMALKLLSDFLAAFLFGVFLFAFLFWRSGPSLFISATALGLATLVRPTFTFVPLLIPIAAYLVGRCASKLPVLHAVAFVFASLAATGVSSLYQYSFQGYAGPSPVLAKNIGRTLDVIASGRDDNRRIDYEAFNRKIAQRAGKPYSAVSPSEEEKYAVEFFLAELKARPGAVLLQLSKTVVKYLLAPVDSAVIKIVQFFNPESEGPRYLRIVLGLFCFPVWLLSITPPFGSSKEVWAYYILTALFVAYVLGLTAINPFLGERIRFPVLGLMLPMAAWNISNLPAFLSRQATAITNGTPIA
jgi:hypothetical protein